MEFYEKIMKLKATAVKVIFQKAALMYDRQKNTAVGTVGTHD
jgi:hypothetical protein